MLYALLGKIACLFGFHFWDKHPQYHYILNDSDEHFYACRRCTKVARSRVEWRRRNDS